MQTGAGYVTIAEVCTGAQGFSQVGLYALPTGATDNGGQTSHIMDARFVVGFGTGRLRNLKFAVTGH